MLRTQRVIDRIHERLKVLEHNLAVLNRPHPVIEGVTLITGFKKTEALQVHVPDEGTQIIIILLKSAIEAQIKGSVAEIERMIENL